jgi:ABC-type transport system substrate-binding protein
MRQLSFCLLLLLFRGISSADTQDYIKGNVILLRSDIAYIDIGEKDGVIPGEQYEIYYDQRLITSGKIAWSDKNISKSDPLNPAIAAELANYGLPLLVKIKLYVTQANRGGHLNLAYFSELNLDPAEITSPEDMMISRLIHRGLLVRDRDGRIVPDLCGDYEIRDLTYTFYLNPDAKFHTGRPVESSDVLYSLEQLASSPKLTNASSFVLEIVGAEDYRNKLKSEISGIFIIEKNILSITLKQPFPAFEEYLAGPAGYIIPRPGVISSGGITIGAGPYRIKWRDSDALALEPFESPGQMAYLDSIKFVRYANIDEAGLSFELGHLDMINLLGEPPPKFVTHGNFTSQNSNTNDYVILGINNSLNFQKNEYFAKALSFLLDRSSIIRVILGGSGARPFFQIPTERNESISLASPFFPDSAASYLDSIAVPPQNLTLYVDPKYPILTRIARYLEGQLLNKGIKVIVKTIEMSSLDKLSVQNDMDMYLTCFIPVSGMADCILYPLISDRLLGETNLLYFNDEAAQTFTSDLHIETDPARRNSLADGIAQSLANDPPLVFLYQPFQTIIMRTDISGLVNDPAGYVDLRRAFIEMER